MESPRALSDQLSVLGQIEPADVADLAAMGFRVLIDNRPDSEIEPALDSAAMRQAAQDAGMEFLYIPYAPGPVSEEMIAEYADACGLPGPALAYCRSGTRSTTLWALSSASQMTPEAIIETAASAGYDISGLAPILHARR